MTDFKSGSSRDGMNVWHTVTECECVYVNRAIISSDSAQDRGELTDQKIELQHIRSLGPTPLPEHSACARVKHIRIRLSLALSSFSPLYLEW